MKYLAIVAVILAGPAWIGYHLWQDARTTRRVNSLT